MTSKAERNMEVCRMYQSGASTKVVGEHFSLSRENVRMILRSNGIPRRKKERGSNRDEFLGINISEADKSALRAEAARRGVSMSSLTADLIKEMLATIKEE